MKTITRQFNRFFEERIKLIVIIQLILVIPVVTYAVYTWSSDINRLHEGIFYLMVAFVHFLNVIENIILRKKGTSIIWLIPTVLFVIIGIDNLLDI